MALGIMPRDLCCYQLRHAFYILVHKQEIIKKLSEKNFVPNTNYASLNKNTINREESTKCIFSIKYKKIH